MSFSVGIVGLPNVGKSTTFNALLKKKQAEASNFPFCTIEPNVGRVNVPDERLEQLANVSRSQKIIPTAIEFVDIAGLVSGAHKGEGLGNQFLSHIREVDAIVEVVRNFQNPDITHVAGAVNPTDDIATINLELIMADLAAVTKRRERAEKEAKSGDKKIAAVAGMLARLQTHLETERPARDFTANNEDEAALLQELNLLTAKPLMYLVNIDDKKAVAQLQDVAELQSTPHVVINAKLEAEIAELDDAEQEEYKKELGVTETGLDKLITEAYRLLNLVTYFTSGEPETRAWTVSAGALAPAAAGVIHTDFTKGFIRAEVINWKDFVNAGGWSRAKEKGLVRTEGKTYEVCDGDVCYFLVS